MLKNRQCNFHGSMRVIVFLITTSLAGCVQHYALPAWNQKLPPAERFAPALNGEAVLDKETGLVWERVPGDAWKHEWSIAAGACTTNKTIDGRKGWRLPALYELLTLVDTTQQNPSLPSGHPFQLGGKNAFWSASRKSGSLAYGVYMNSGQYFLDETVYKFNIWCVRGGYMGQAYIGESP